MRSIDQQSYDSLERVIRPDYIPNWLEIPKSAFDNLRPLEVIEHG